MRRCVGVRSGIDKMRCSADCRNRTTLGADDPWVGGERLVSMNLWLAKNRDPKTGKSLDTTGDKAMMAGCLGAWRVVGWAGEVIRGCRCIDSRGIRER